MAEQWNHGRPPEGQSPNQESRIDRASKLGEANGNQTVNTDVSGRTKTSRDKKEIKRETYYIGKQYDHGRPPEGQNSQ